MGNPDSTAMEELQKQLAERKAKEAGEQLAAKQKNMKQIADARASMGSKRDASGDTAAADALVRCLPFDEWHTTQWHPDGQFEKVTWYQNLAEGADASAQVAVAMLRAQRKRPLSERLQLIQQAVEEEGATAGTIVQLEDNNLSDPELLSQIREALEGNQKVIELILSENEIKDGAALAALCCGLPNLQRFDAGFNLLANDGVEAWCKTIGQHASMTHLSLRDCEIGVDGAAIVAEFIKADNLPALQYLNLRQNTLGAAGATDICEALMEHKAIRMLDLRECAISGGAGEAIGSMIKNVSSLTMLAICRNNLADAGTAAIAKVLGGAAHMRTVWMMDCKIGTVGGKALAKLFARNKTLLNCDIRTNPQISQISKRYVADSCSANRRRADRGGVDSEESDDPW